MKKCATSKKLKIYEAKIMFTTHTHTYMEIGLRKYPSSELTGPYFTALSKCSV